VSLNTSDGGEHAHKYKDIFWGEDPRWSVHDDFYQVNGIGSNLNDWNNYGWQITRTTYENGNHNHDLNGQSHTSHSSITKTGNNEKHENRQPYYVVASIVFLDLI
jgi:hypothetical protein